VPAMSVTLDSRPGRAAVLASRAVVAGVFVWAAIPKILDPAQFAESIANYHLLAGRDGRPLAAGLPVLELVVAAALLLGVQARGAALVAIALLVVFAGGMAQAILRASIWTAAVSARRRAHRSRGGASHATPGCRLRPASSPWARGGSAGAVLSSQGRTADAAVGPLTGCGRGGHAEGGCARADAG